MLKNFSPNALGINGRQSELIELALTYGFRGMDVDLGDMFRRSQRSSADESAKYLRATDLLIGGFELDVDLDAEDWLEVSTFECVIASNEIFVGYSASLEERNPAVAKMLSNVQFTGDEINGWIVEMFDNKRDPQIVAEEWIEDNQAIVDGWING